MAVFHARGTRAPDTMYATFKVVHNQRSLTRDGDASTDVDIGKSPITRWLTYAFDYDDGASNANGRYTYSFLVPRGAIILDCIVRVDTAFTGSASDINIGDSNQASGYADALDLTTAISSSTPNIYRDANAVYIDVTQDAAAATTGPQIYINGGTVVATAQGDPTTITAGKGILFLKTISYNEPLNSEYT